MGKQTIYPGMGRVNYHSPMYSEIAMKNYYEAKKLYEAIVSNNYNINDMLLEKQMDEHIVITCIFAAMAIESFLNNYASACLGDADFYDNFDKLSVISKFQLVARFILKKDIDKNKSYYSNLKSLIKQRDLFVHNKSKKSSFQGYTYEEMCEIEEFIKKHDVVEEIPTLNKIEIKKDFMIAQTAIKAMRDFAYFMDDEDSNSQALATFFKKYDPEKCREIYYNEVIRDFKI